MRFLLVESDKILAENLSAALDTTSHQIDWQVDLQSAIESLDANPPDAVIIDLNLAGRSGVELLYELRSYPEWQDLPIYVWSDIANSKDALPNISLSGLNISKYFHKPTASISEITTSLTSQLSSA